MSPASPPAALPRRRLPTSALLGVIVVAAAATGLLLSDSGLLARLLGAGPGEFPPLVAGPWWVAVVVEYAWKESAFVMLVVLAATAATERDLDEAGAVLGAGPWRRLRGIGLPLAAPAFATGATLAVDGLNQQVLSAWQAAMLWVAGTTGPLSRSQPLRPCLTL